MKRKRVDILLTEKLHDALIKRTEEDQITKTEVITIALKKHL